MPKMTATLKSKVGDALTEQFIELGKERLSSPYNYKRSYLYAVGIKTSDILRWLVDKHPSTTDVKKELLNKNRHGFFFRYFANLYIPAILVVYENSANKEDFKEKLEDYFLTHTRFI